MAGNNYSNVLTLTSAASERFVEDTSGEFRAVTITRLARLEARRCAERGVKNCLVSILSADGFTLATCHGGYTSLAKTLAPTVETVAAAPVEDDLDDFSFTGY